MNYLFNCTANTVFGFGGSEDLRVEKQEVLIDSETSKEAAYPYIVGKTYICVEKWLIKKGYSVVKECKTEAEAQTELKQIVDKLEGKGNNIIKV